MKQKLFTVTLLSVIASTYAYADMMKVGLYGNTAPLYLADASSSTQPKIQGMNAGGENQTTIIDSNGNLKIIDKPASASQPAAEGPTSNNMSTERPSVAPQGPGNAANLPKAPSGMTGPNNVPDGTPTVTPSRVPTPGSSNTNSAASQALPETAPGMMEPNNALVTTPNTTQAPVQPSNNAPQPLPSTGSEMPNNAPSAMPGNAPSAMPNNAPSTMPNTAPAPAATNR